MRKRVAAALVPLPPASPRRPANVPPSAVFSGTYLPFIHDMALRSRLFSLFRGVVVERSDTGFRVRPLLPTGAAVALVPMTTRFYRTPASPVATHLFLEDAGRMVLFGEHQDTYRRLTHAEALGLSGGLAAGAGVLVLSVLAALAVGVGWLFGRAWVGPAAPLLSFGAAGILLSALLAGFFVLGRCGPARPSPPAWLSRPALAVIAAGQPALAVVRRAGKPPSRPRLARLSTIRPRRRTGRRGRLSGNRGLPGVGRLAPASDVARVTTAAHHSIRSHAGRACHLTNLAARLFFE